MYDGIDRVSMSLDSVNALISAELVFHRLARLPEEEYGEGLISAELKAHRLARQQEENSIQLKLHSVDVMMMMSVSISCPFGVTSRALSEGRVQSERS